LKVDLHEIENWHLLATVGAKPVNSRLANLT